MFELPSLGPGRETAIPTLVPAEDLFELLAMVEIEAGSKHDRVQFRISDAADNLPIELRLKAQELADRFDCEVVSVSVNRSIRTYCAARTGLQLLAEASQRSSVKVARLGIAELRFSKKCHDGSLYSEWWTLIRHLRSDWQIELTKLVWENQHELVNRPDQPRRVHPNGRYAARKRETIMVQRKIPWDEVAAYFNPASDVSTVVIRDELISRMSSITDTRQSPLPRR